MTKCHFERWPIGGGFRKTKVLSGERFGASARNFIYFFEENAPCSALIALNRRVIARHLV